MSVLLCGNLIRLCVVPFETCLILSTTCTQINQEHYMKGKLIKKFGLGPDYANKHTAWQILQVWDAGKKICSKTV